MLQCTLIGIYQKPLRFNCGDNQSPGYDSFYLYIHAICLARCLLFMCGSIGLEFELCDTMNPKLYTLQSDKSFLWKYWKWVCASRVSNDAYAMWKFIWLKPLKIKGIKNTIEFNAFCPLRWYNIFYNHFGYGGNCATETGRERMRMRE